MQGARTRRVLARDIAGLVIFLALCYAAAALGGYWASQGLGPWYERLHKPAWTPPAWLFPPVWTILYATMAVAAWQVWRSAGRAQARRPLFLFGLQLGLNAAWPALFFAYRNPGAAFVEMVWLWAAILATLRAFARISRAGALVLVPYWLWVTYAAVLNFAIWQQNG